MATSDIDKDRSWCHAVSAYLGLTSSKGSGLANQIDRMQQIIDHPEWSAAPNIKTLTVSQSRALFVLAAICGDGCVSFCKAGATTTQRLWIISFVSSHETTFRLLLHNIELLIEDDLGVPLRDAPSKLLLHPHPYVSFQTNNRAKLEPIYRMKLSWQHSSTLASHIVTNVKPLLKDCTLGVILCWRKWWKLEMMASHQLLESRFSPRPGDQECIRWQRDSLILIDQYLRSTVTTDTISSSQGTCSSSSSSSSSTSQSAKRVNSVRETTNVNASTCLSSKSSTTSSSSSSSCSSSFSSASKRLKPNDPPA